MVNIARKTRSLRDKPRRLSRSRQPASWRRCRPLRRAPQGLSPLHDVKISRAQFARNLLSHMNDGGASRNRTDDLKLAKLALSQLSYGPVRLALTPCTPESPPQPQRLLVGLGRFELPTSRLSSARSNQLSYRPESRIVHEKKEKRRRRCPACVHSHRPDSVTGTVNLSEPIRRHDAET